MNLYRLYFKIWLGNISGEVEISDSGVSTLSTDSSTPDSDAAYARKNNFDGNLAGEINIRNRLGAKKPN